MQLAPVEGEIVMLLTPEEEAWLTTREQVIAGGLQTFLDVGNALMEIRDDPRKVYRMFGTFENYCRERWNFSDRRARQLISAAEVTADIGGDETGTVVPVLPKNEAQVRPLTSLPPEQQVEAWNAAVAESGGKQPSAKMVEKHVAKRKTPKTPKTPKTEEVKSLSPVDEPVPTAPVPSEEEQAAYRFNQRPEVGTRNLPEPKLIMVGDPTGFAGVAGTLMTLYSEPTMRGFINYIFMCSNIERLYYWQTKIAEVIERKKTQ